MNKFKLMMWAMIASATLFTACGKDKKDNPKPKTKVEISSNTTWSGNKTFSLPVIVRSGATLTIEKGSTIKFSANGVNYLLIEQGAKIVAEGSASAPIVLTVDNESAGEWGGLHICGKAPINSGQTGLSEIGDAVYGGTQADDNSGVLRYVRVEYSGAELDGDHQGNGISFYGVGSGTTVEYIDVYKGKDDGIECFGGSVNMKYVRVYAAGDDSFDWVEGWQGKGQFLLAIQGNAGDRGFEGDNLKSDNSATPMSAPTLANVTLIGQGNADNAGMKLRRGTAGIFKNIIVGGNFDKRSIDIDNSETLRNLVSGKLLIDYAYLNSHVSDTTVKYTADANDPVDITGHEVTASAHVFTLDLSTGLQSATTYPGGYDMSADDSFFTPTDFIGSGDSWTSGWIKQ